MSTIVPNLWFAGNAEEGAQFYARTFRNATAAVTSRYPASGLPDFQVGMAGQALTVDVTIGASAQEADRQRLTLINAGAEFRPNPALSIMVNFDPSVLEDAQAYLDSVWACLCDGGTVLMELGSYPFSERYGWVEDRYGVSWQLILTNPAGEPRPFLIPSFVFSGPVQNRAQEAVEFYTTVFGQVFGHSQLATSVPYPRPDGPAAAGALMFSDFTLAGEWFTAMDSGTEMSQTFTAGFSLVVRCQDQQQIDQLWEALSADPAAEQCGWCVDKFGVSWQIVPAALDGTPMTVEAYQAVLGMKKLVIADIPGL
ncbi:MAG: VOC family protein [Beutenbergiaceae bacterium]